MSQEKKLLFLLGALSTIPFFPIGLAEKLCLLITASSTHDPLHLSPGVGVGQSHLEIKQIKKLKIAEWVMRPANWSQHKSPPVPAPPLSAHVWIFFFFRVCIYEQNLLESNAIRLYLQAGSGPQPISPLSTLLPSVYMIKHTIVIVSGETQERFPTRWLSACRLLCYFSVTSKSAARRQSQRPPSGKWWVTAPHGKRGWRHFLWRCQHRKQQNISVCLIYIVLIYFIFN